MGLAFTAAKPYCDNIAFKMNIKLKLSLQFTLIVIGILVFFAALVYYFSYNTHVSKYHSYLEETAKNSAILLINVVEVDSALLKKIHQSTVTGEREEVVITDSAFRVLYRNRAELLTPQFIRSKVTGGLRGFYALKDKDGIFYRHVYNNRTYFVFVMGYDRMRHENLPELLQTLVWSILISAVLAVYLSYIFSRRAISPISRLVSSIKNISAKRLNTRLEEGNRKDEIAQLAMSFNEMLSELETAFRNQEEFISNASHELRTPFSVMLMETEYMLNKDRQAEEYREHLHKLSDDIRKLNGLVNSLLEMAQLNRSPELLKHTLRIDEIVFESVKQTKQRYPSRKIVSRINYPDHNSDLLVQGHAGLLQIAFNNVLGNACKFSDNDILVEFVITDKEITVSVTDTGIGIPSNQISKVVNAFTRGSNAKFKSGFGIGLSLVHKILEMHRVHYRIESDEDKGTIVKMTFTRLGF